MHLLFLTDNFPPEVNAPASRTHEHCRAWVASGLRVTVITSAPNFPTGKVFPGYRNRLWQAEEIDGIRVIRVWTYITANEGFVRRIADYVSFMVAATMAALFVRKVDVIIGTSPQFFTAVAARMVSTLKQRPWIFELRDLWPESIKAVGAMRESLALRWLERLELALYRHANRIVAVTHTFREDLARRGIPSDKIDVITNGVDSEGFSPRERDPELARSLGLDGCFVAGYIGTHGLAHGLRTLLDAAERLREESDGESIRLVLLGNGAEKGALVAEAGQRGLDNVVFLDSVPKAEVARYWALLDVAIIHLRKTELFTSVIPSKLFECMGMGIPVLHGVAGESAEIVRREDVGEVFESEDAEALVTGLLRMRRDASLRARYAMNGPRAARHYDRKVLADNMLEVIRATGGR
ncbi:MAG: glycosyltransferase family 4 protein [Pseudomonadales bacterium]|nr:glycosyltransferase family 4 protein [Pseudomonadales bacterium]